MTMWSAPSQLYLAIEAVDMRIGIDGLSQRVQQSLGQAPCDGSAYAFRNKTGTRIKVVIWDGTGVWLCLRRLHKGRFVWPQSHDSVCTLSHHRGGLDTPIGTSEWSVARLKIVATPC